MLRWAAAKRWSANQNRCAAAAAIFPSKYSLALPCRPEFVLACSQPHLFLFWSNFLRASDADCGRADCIIHIRRRPDVAIKFANTFFSSNPAYACLRPDLFGVLAARNLFSGWQRNARRCRILGSASFLGRARGTGIPGSRRTIF